MKILRYLPLFFFFIQFTSCSIEEKCRQNKNVRLGVSLFHADLSITHDTITISKLTIDSITVKGLRYDSVNVKYVLMDSILYNDTKSISSLYLPLHKFQNISKYQIKLNTKIDTITVLHTNSDNYLSFECGCIKVHSIDTVLTTNHFIDSIRISNHIVNNVDAENIRIYK